MESTTALASRTSDACLHRRSGDPAENTFLEFFAGIGLVHRGLAAAGRWKCIYANDIEAKKKRMYEDCFGPTDYYHVEDVWKTNKIVSAIPPERADLATASFPCVDLSLAGNLKGLAGIESGAFYGFIGVLKRLREEDRLPKAVLIENVIGFLAAHNGKNFRAAMRELANLGYCLDAFIADAKHFVPQSRPRLFLVGCSPDLLPNGADRPEPAPTMLRPHRLVDELSRLKSGWFPFDLPLLPPENRTLHDVIDMDDSQDWWNQTQVNKHLKEMHPEHRQRVDLFKQSAYTVVGTIYRRVRKGSSKSEIRTDGLAGCLRTPRGGSSKQIVFIAGEGRLRMRWMTPREYARLQGCPDFPIKVDRNEALFGFGDAVCVPVITWIAENVLGQVFPTSVYADQLQQVACG